MSYRCMNCGTIGTTCHQQCYYKSCKFCGTEGCLAICPEGKAEMNRRREVEVSRLKTQAILEKYPINPRVVMLEDIDDEVLLLN